LPLILNNNKNSFNKNTNITKSNFDNNFNNGKNYNNYYSISNYNNKNIRSIFNTDSKRNTQAKNKRLSFDDYQNFNSLTEQSNNDKKPLFKNNIIIQENCLIENSYPNKNKNMILKAILSPNKNKINQISNGNPKSISQLNSQITPYLNIKSNNIEGDLNKFQTPKKDFHYLHNGNQNNYQQNYAFTEQINRNFLPKLANNNLFDLKPKNLFKD